MTAEQLEASRAERMRQNGHGTLTLEDARTWIEETGLCLFLPRRQYSASVAPSFVEAVAGAKNPTPDQKQIAQAEDLLVRLENEGVAVRLNLLGQVGEQPDFVVAGWVLPYVYALRGDRDWRRSPQLTGSRQVSPLAVQTYKLLEAGETTVTRLTHALGREVTEAAVLRAITELWQQLRIIPTFSARGEAAQWQLLRQRFQKAIAEGASTSQVTAISVLASIYLQAAIAAPMEDVELFLAPLTARSKVREVLRGLVATRQVHTLALGHAPHFYVAGTLPEFSEPLANFTSASVSASSYFSNPYRHEEELSEPVHEATHPPMAEAPEPVAQTGGNHAPRTSAPAAKPAERPHFNRSSRKPSQPSNNRTARRPEQRLSNSSRRTGSAHGSEGTGSGRTAGGPARTAKSAAPAWQRNGHSNGTKPASKSGGVATHNGSSARKDSRPTARPVSRSSRKPALMAGAKAGNSKRFGFTARPKQGAKKRG